MRRSVKACCLLAMLTSCRFESSRRFKEAVGSAATVAPTGKVYRSYAHMRLSEPHEAVEFSGHSWSAYRGGRFVRGSRTAEVGSADPPTASYTSEIFPVIITDYDPANNKVSREELLVLASHPDDQKADWVLLESFRMDTAIKDALDSHNGRGLILLPLARVVDLETRERVRSVCLPVLYDIVSGIVFAFSRYQDMMEFFSSSKLPFQSPFSGTWCTNQSGMLTEYRTDSPLAITSESADFFLNKYLFARGYRTGDWEQNGLHLTEGEGEDGVSADDVIVGGASALIATGLGHLIFRRPKVKNALQFRLQKKCSGQVRWILKI